MASKSHIVVVGAVLAGVAILLVVTGPILPDNANPVAPDQTGTDGSRSPQEASIKLYPDPLDDYSFNASATVTLEVQTNIRIYGHEPFRYENAQVCIYDAIGDVLGRSSLGPIVSPESGEFFRRYTRSVTVSEKPKYVIIDHPQLRNDSRFDTQIRVWKQESDVWGIGRPGLSELQNRFEWPQTNETGTCG